MSKAVMKVERRVAGVGGGRTAAVPRAGREGRRNAKAHAVPVIPPAAAGGAVATDPTIILGGLVAAGVVGGILSMGSKRSRRSRKGTALSDDIDTLKRQASEASDVLKTSLGEQAETEGELESSMKSLNSEWKFIKDARKKLEESEARVKELEKTTPKLVSKAQEIRVKSADAWINNWKARTKLSGTLSVK
mmetsp:Transcript_11280/g.28537  ORF Transcript_11280/g.28537 Transcript_11280/m.28537 type:complete len:191 (+) Transcript_11280:171-743(+)